MGSVHGIWMGNFMGRWIYPNRDQTWQWKSHLFSAMMFPSKNLTFDRQNPSVPTCVTCLIAEGYPLVNIHKTMENHHFSWVNPLFLHFLHFLPSTDLFDYYYFWSATLRWCDETNNILRTGCWMTCRMLNDMRHEQFPKTKCITWTVPEVAAPTRTEQTSQSVNRLRQSNIAIENGP